MNKLPTLYPYCEVAYKTEDSLGWKLALMNGDKEFVTKKCEQYNWFDFIVFNEVSNISHVKDMLNYYPSPDMVHLLTNWIYWKDLDRWFINEDETIPYPLKDCEVTNDIQFTYKFNPDDWDDIDFDDKEEIFVPVDVDFKTKKQNATAHLEIEILYCEIEKFIANLKTKKFAVCHIWEYTTYRLLAWEKDNKIRFLIQHYISEQDKDYFYEIYENDEYKKNGYVPIVFDILVDKEIFYKNFENFYNSLKQESQNLLQETVDAVYKNLRKFKKHNDEYFKWEYLEFTNIKRLWCYITSIKPLLKGNSIDKIFVCPDYIEEVTDYDLSKKYENITLSSGTPIIIEIGKHKLILNMQSGSDLQISLNKDFTVKDTDNTQYFDVSNLFAKNIIGQKIKNIDMESISKADAKSSESWYPQKVLSDNMFKNLIFEFENGYKLEIWEYFDINGISERSKV